MSRNSRIWKLWNDVRWILETGVWVQWQTMPAGLMSRIKRWRNLTVLKFKADAKIEKKIRHDTICPLILSREFWFCLLVQIAQIGTYESIFSSIIAFTSEKLQIYYPYDPTTTLISKTSKTSPVGLAFFHCLTFSLVLWLLTSTFTAFPMFLKVFGCLEHTNNCNIFFHIVVKMAGTKQN